MELDNSGLRLIDEIINKLLNKTSLFGKALLKFVYFSEEEFEDFLRSKSEK